MFNQNSLKRELATDLIRLVTIALSTNASEFDYLPELLALTNYESFINLVNCLGGDVIKIPTRRELRQSLGVVLVLLYTEINLPPSEIKNNLHLTSFLYDKYYKKAMELKDKLVRYRLIYNANTNRLIEEANKLTEELSKEVDQAQELTDKFSAMMNKLPKGVTALSTNDLMFNETDVRALIISLLSSYNQLI